MMSFVCLNNSAYNDCLLSPQFELSNTTNEMENVECVVRPPTSNNDAIPDESTVTTICPMLRHFNAIVLYRNVFPIPAPLFRKKTIPLFL